MSLNARPSTEGSIQACGAITELRFVGFDGNQASVQGQKCRGVSAYAGAEGDWVRIIEKGSAVVETGGAINPGDDIITDDEGRAIAASALALGAIAAGTLAVAAGATAVTSSAANGAIITGAPTIGALTGATLPDCLQGRAINAATGEGQFIEVLLQ